MNNNLQIFTNEQFGAVRTVLLKGEPWFVGKDVAEILGYERPTKAILDRVEEEDRLFLNEETQSQHRTTFDYKQLGQRGGWLINESGLYGLILSSKLPQAKQFKRWVTVEVLPTIRKTGGYISNADLMVNTYFGALGEEHKGLIKGLFTNIEEQQKQLQLKQAIIEEQAPKVANYEKFMNTNGLTDMSNLAKLLSEEFNGKLIGRNILMECLREMKVLTSYNAPYQQYVERGYFKVKQSDEAKANGQFYNTTFITPKGIDWLIKRLNNELEEIQAKVKAKKKAKKAILGF